MTDPNLNRLAILGAGALIAAALFADMQRYQIVSDPSPERSSVFRLDQWTGQVIHCVVLYDVDNKQWRTVKEQFPANSNSFDCRRFKTP